jgi:hypothetical protein
MNKLNDLEQRGVYLSMVGKTLHKRSGKPFSSGEKQDLSTGLIINDNSGKIAFTFKDSKLVDCFQCRVVSLIELEEKL